MARNGSGVYTPPAANYPAVSGTLIEAADRNAIDADIATALTNSLAVNGESVVTANIPMAGNKLTGLGAATARTDAASIATIQDGTGVYSGTVGGTADVITITPSPAIAAYAAGQLFSFIASGANTTNVTVNVSGLGAKAVTKNGATALAAGDIPSGFLATVRYDGTRFQLVGAKDAFTGGNVANATTFSSSVTVTGATDLNGALTIDGGATATTDITMTAATVKLAKGADVASAGALPLITDGNYFDVTGTTSITSMNTMGVGTQIVLHFDGALILTHHATDLILPSGANITTAAGDEAGFIEYATGDWRCVYYTKATGRALVSDGTSFSSNNTTTGGTAIEFTSVIPSTANEFTISFKGFSTSGASPFILQVGVGGVYVTTGYEGWGANMNGAAISGASVTSGFPLGNVPTAGANYAGYVTFRKASGNIWNAVGGLGSGSSVALQGWGGIDAGGVVDSIRFTTTGGANTVDANGGVIVSWRT